jgi:hypothetical protein
LADAFGEFGQGAHKIKSLAQSRKSAKHAKNSEKLFS